MAKILYIEDNPHNMRLVRKMLHIDNYDVIEALSGQDGIAKAHDELPDLILLDINLPDLDGIEVCSRLRASEKVAWIPIIALTANAMHGDRERFLESGMDGYLAKPITRNELLNTVRHYLTNTNSEDI
jgi:two-component system, cell cycle response regulator DivK